MRWFYAWRKKDKKRVTPGGKRLFDRKTAMWLNRTRRGKVVIREKKTQLSLREKIARKALSQRGVVERPFGSNSGRKVRQYQHSTSLGGTGWPWCVAFIVWCADQCNATYANYYGAYCPHLLADAKRHGKFTKTARRGFAVLYDFDGDGVADHTGIVVEVHKRYIVTVEGNTSADNRGSQSNGGGVFKRSRKRNSQIIGYVQPSRKVKKSS